MRRIGLPSAAAALTVSAVLSVSCKVGPHYTRPLTPMTPVYKELPPGDDQWKASTPRDGELKGKWWEIFEDPQLNALEERVNVTNQSLKQAEAVYRQAQGVVAGNRAGYFPTVTTTPSITTTGTGASRTNSSGNRASGISTLFNIPFSATWAPDLWGRIRLAVENSTDLAQASAGDLENARLLYHTELASDYFQLLATDMQKKLLDDTLAGYEKALQLTINRFNGGVASKADVAQAQTQVDTTRAQRTDLEVARSQFEHAIAMLTGQPPANVTIEAGAIKGPPPPIPVGLPSQLLERRPDIAAAERRVAALNVQIGLAEVAYYPTLTLSGTAGVESTALTTLIRWPSRLWTVGPSISETLFDFGRRRAVVQQMEAAYDAAVANYRQSVLLAFQQVEDNLAALHTLEVEAAQEEQAIRSAEQSVALELERYKGGVDSYLNVITTQTIALSDERAAVTILQRRMIAAVDLISALGGGWNAANLPNPEQVKGTTGQ
jgi:NodT family efflux transporter outer membrane factor (OMF) lipoprotein